MSWSLVEEHVMDGAATAAGDPVDGGTQHGAGALWWKRDGAGHLVPDASRVLPDYLLWPLPDGLANDYKVEVDLSIDASYTGSSVLNAVGRAVSPFTMAGGGGVALDVLMARLRFSGDVDTVHGTTPVTGDSYGIWSDYVGPGDYTLVHEMRKTEGEASTRNWSRIGYQSTPGTYFASTNTGVGDLAEVDSTPNLNDENGAYLYGLAGMAAATVPSGLQITAIRLYVWGEVVPDTTPPELTAGAIDASGSTFEAALSEACTPIADPQGFSMQAREDSGHGWSDWPLAGVVMLTADGLGLYGSTAEPVPEGWEARLGYLDGDVEDAAGNAMEAQTLALTNNSTQPVEDLSVGTPEYLAATRGEFRCGTSTTRAGTEEQTSFAMYCPYGLKRGTGRVTFLGITDGGISPRPPSNIEVIKAVLCVRQKPGEATVRVPLTFAGNAGAVVAPNTVVQSDFIPIQILPGAKVWPRTWYRKSDPLDGMPVMSPLNTYEFDGLGTESGDGTYSQAYGAGVDLTLTGGFDHSAIGDMNEGLAYYCGGWRPAQLEGEVHQSWTGDVSSALVIGDSITHFADNATQSDPPNEFDFQGYQGYAFQADIPYTTSAIFGSTYVSPAGTAVFRHIAGNRSTKMRKFTDLVNGFGVNVTGAPNGANIYASQRAAAYALFTAYGVQVWDLPLTPRNDQGGSQAAYDVLHAQFNTIVRSGVGAYPGRSGWFEVDADMEVNYLLNTNRNVLLYIGALHPTTPGHVSMGTQIRAAALPAFAAHQNPPVAVVTPVERVMRSLSGGGMQATFRGGGVR